MTHKLSETEKHLAEVMSARPKYWFKRPDLESIIHQTSGLNWRIVALRKAGYNIENRLEHKGRKKESYYRIV